MEPVARPLYAQVRDALVSRIADGEWTAGQALPSEFALAAQLGVSQGTVRKALDALAADNLVERRQGRGTYVPEHTEERALYHFFRMQDANGAPVLPFPVSQRISSVLPPADVARILGAGRRKIWQISRIRAVSGVPAILEHIYLDPRRFPSLTPTTVLPNALYSHYQATAGITVARADDLLSAVSADHAIAGPLGITVNTPVLLSKRVARDMRDAAIEVRFSWFLTENQFYAVSLK